LEYFKVFCPKDQGPNLANDIEINEKNQGNSQLEAGPIHPNTFFTPPFLLFQI